MLLACDITEFSERVALCRSQWTINDVTYRQILTCGDGACGLHAVWGSPHSQKGLFEFDIRAKLVNKMPEHIQELLSLFDGMDDGGELWRTTVRQFLREAWKDHGKQAARAVLINGQANSREAHIFWSHLPPDVQASWLEYVQHEDHEKQRGKELTEQLRVFARSLFVRSLEEVVCRPLCKELHALSADADLDECCPDHGYESRYEALYDPSEQFDNIRLSIFMHPLRKHVILEIFNKMIEELRCDGHVHEADLLQQGQRIWAARLSCFGAAEDPEGIYNVATAWEAMRLCFMANEYWLSPGELHFIAAAVGVKVDVYLEKEEEEEFELQLMCNDSAVCLSADAICVQVLLERQGSGSSRGHFSRLCSAEARSAWKL